MTEVSRSQPSSADAYQHKCSEPECIYHGQRTAAHMCNCHKPREQMMAARIEALETALRFYADNCSDYGRRARAVLDPTGAA